VLKLTIGIAAVGVFNAPKLICLIQLNSMNEVENIGSSPNCSNAFVGSRFL